MREAVPARRGPGVALPVGLGVAVGLAALVHPALAVVAVVGAAAGWVGLRRPDLLVAFMFLAVLFDRMGAMSSEIAGLPLTMSKLSVVASLGLWAAHAWLHRAAPLRWHPVLSGLCVLVGAAAVTMLVRGDVHAARFTLYGMGMVTVLVALVYVILADRDLAPLTRILAAALSLSVLVGLAGPLRHGAHGRLSGTMGDANEWGTVLLLLGPALLGGLAADDTRLGRVLRIALMALVPLGVLASGSRTALLVGVLAAVPMAWVLRRRRAEVAAVGAGGAVGLLILGGMGGLSATFARLGRLWDSVQGTAVVHDESLRERTELLHQGWSLFLDHWLVGVGPGRFEEASGFVAIDGRLRPVHNTYLEVASEQGLVGLAAGAVFFGLLVWTLWTGAAAAPPGRRARILGSAVGLGAFALMAGTLNLMVFSMAYLVLGLTLAATHPAPRPADG